MIVSFAAGALWRYRSQAGDSPRSLQRNAREKETEAHQYPDSAVIGHVRSGIEKGMGSHHQPEATLSEAMKFRGKLDTLISDHRVSTCAVALVNVDRLKLINDTMGYQAGDQLLRGAAERLKLYEGDRVFHYKGDEFAVLFQDMTRKEVIRHLEQILRAFAMPMQLNQGSWYESVTIGASFYPDDAGDGCRLLRSAKSALHDAKKVSRGHYRLYDPKIRLAQSRRLAMETDLREAVKESQFSLYYQPQVDLVAGRLVGTEALIRWKHPKHGIISPAVFIPLAEEVGLIGEIGEWVLQEACGQTKKWNDRGYSLNISVNLSPKQLFQGHLADTVSRVLRETGLVPNHLQLEITETADADLTIMAKELAELKTLQVGISIDDFGTGYNSLNYLKSLPLSQLKIDRSFIMGEHHGPRDTALVRMITDLAGKFHLQVVAEGVETSEHIRFLKETHCGIAQGYLFSKPLPPDQFEREIASINRKISETSGEGA